jgi:hypothetical protein
MLVEIEWHPTDRQLRVFGVSGLVASIAAALVLSFVWGVAILWSIIVLAAGAAIFLCSLTSVKVTRILYIALTIVGMPIGLVVSLILLAAFYFLLLTPLALVFRLIGRDPLYRSWRGRPALASRGHPGLVRPDCNSRVATEVQGQDALATEEQQGQDGLATSYWVPHKSNEDTERYFHQF